MRDKTKEKVRWAQVLRATAQGLRIWWNISPQLLISGGLLRALDALSPYVTLWFSARLLEEIAGAHRGPQLARLALAAALAAALLALLRNICYHWYNRLSVTDRWHKAYHRYTEKMLSMDFSRMDDPKTRETYDAIMQAQQWNGGGLQMNLRLWEDLLPGALRVLGAVALCAGLFTSRVPAGSALAWLDHPLALLGLLALLLAVVAAAPLCQKRIADLFASLSDHALLDNRLFFHYGSPPAGTDRGMDVRTYQQERIYAGRLTANPSFGRFDRLNRGPAGGYSALGTALSHSITGAAYLFVCLKAWAGAFGVGAVTQYVGAITNFAGGLLQLLGAAAQARANLPFLQRVLDYFALPNEMYQGSLSVEKRRDRNYEVAFRDVSFRYPGSETYALRHVNFAFRVGQRLAVVGENGSGKTTFIKLLCRLYDPTEGQILLNGIDIRKYDYDQYKEVFSVVFQDFQLLGLPLGQNVAGSAGVDAARAADCLHKAGLDAAWLARQPRGLDTSLYRELDENGVNVSGGEAQKIAIARALYKDAPFIVLDEPTAALDPIAEAEVYAGFDALIQDRTAIYISHRLSSCRFCDAIAVFDGGRIVQQGSHEQLVAAEGKYAAMWQAQAQYYV